MSTENSEILLKCLELTKHIVDRNMGCFINIKLGEGKSEFSYNFNNVLKKKISPSQEKRNNLRKQEYIKNKEVKTEDFDEKVKDDETFVTKEDVIEKNVNEEERAESKKPKVLKFKVAAHMRVAAETVLEKVVSNFSRKLSRKIDWFREESKWDLEEKVDGEFSGIHIYGIKISDDDPLEIILENIKKNWKNDPFPAKLIHAWID